VADADLPRFFCVAYYAEKVDFINVLLLSMLAASPELAAVRCLLQSACCFYVYRPISARFLVGSNSHTQFSISLLQGFLGIHVGIPTHRIHQNSQVTHSCGHSASCTCTSNTQMLNPSPRFNYCGIANSYACGLSLFRSFLVGVAARSRPAHLKELLQQPPLHQPQRVAHTNVRIGVCLCRG